MNTQNKITGIVLLLLFVCITTALLNASFIKPLNLVSLIRYISLFGIIGIGAVFVIITGGIDLSIGSLIGLTGCILTLTLNGWSERATAGENLGFVARLLCIELVLVAVGLTVWSAIQRRRQGTGRRQIGWIGLCSGLALLTGLIALFGAKLDLPSWVTIPVCLSLVMIVALHAGLLHGFLITKLHLQPFVVTLCGLMCYRGLSRWLANDRTQGFGTTYDESLRLLAIGKPCTATFVMMVAGIATTIWGLGRLVFGDRERRGQSWTWGAVLTVMGIALTVVGSSKFWDGWQTSYGETLISIAGVDLKTFGAEVSEEAQRRPAELMRYAIYPLALAGLALLIVISRRLLGSNRLRAWLGQVLLPGILIGGGVIGLFLIKRWIGDDAVMLNELTWDRVAKFSGVCLGMAITMTGVFLFMMPITRSGECVDQALLTMTGFSAIMWLLSLTSIHDTKIQVPFFVLCGVALLAGIFLRQTIFGRYLFALGRNEEATRYSGINTDRMIILAYVICAVCSGIGGILFTLDSNNVEPSGHGNFYELYAIAAAVLGGCSLRGGEGSIIGVILGASIMRVLFNAPNMIGISQQLELFTMGTVILIGVMTDEQIRRAAARRLNRGSV